MKRDIERGSLVPDFRAVPIHGDQTGMGIRVAGSARFESRHVSFRPSGERVDSQLGNPDAGIVIRKLGLRRRCGVQTVGSMKSSVR